MSAFKGYDGATWRTTRRLQAYDGTAWRDIRRVQVYDGTAWRDATPAWLSAVTGTDTGGGGWNFTVSFVSTAVASLRYRTRINAGAFSSWTTVNNPTTGSTLASGVNTAGDIIRIEVQPYTAVSLGGDAGPTYIVDLELA